MSKIISCINFFNSLLLVRSLFFNQQEAANPTVLSRWTTARAVIFGTSLNTASAMWLSVSPRRATPGRPRTYAVSAASSLSFNKGVEERGKRESHGKKDKERERLKQSQREREKERRRSRVIRAKFQWGMNSKTFNKNASKELEKYGFLKEERKCKKTHADDRYVAVRTRRRRTAPGRLCSSGCDWKSQ